MAKHPRTVRYYEGKLEQLAKAIGNMTYDQTALFIEELAKDIKKQADADLARGNTKLAKKLYSTAEELFKAKEQMDSAWKICKPYMKRNQ